MVNKYFAELTDLKKQEVVSLKKFMGFMKEERGGIAENAAWIVLVLIIVVGVVAGLNPNIKAAQTNANSKLDNARTFTY